MESFWLIAICALAASIGSLLALRPGERERTTWFFLLVTAGLAGFPVFALGHSLGWWGRIPEGGWAAGPQVVSLPGEQRAALENKSLSFAEFLRSENLMLRADLLRPWANWVTPKEERSELGG